MIEPEKYTDDGRLISDEWGSPPDLVAAARAVLGGMIVLDPASCKAANQIVQAETYYTKAENGLGAWNSWNTPTMYFNPPYSDLPGWVGRLLAEYDQGNVGACCALLPARTDTAWFQPLFQFPICFLHGRPRHLPLVGQGESGTGKFPSVVVYLGPDDEAFADRFSVFGAVMRGMRPARFVVAGWQPPLALEV